LTRAAAQKSAWRRSIALLQMAEFKAENNCIATTTIREAKIYENNKEAYWGSFGGGHVDCLAGHGSTNSLHARNDQRASVQTEDGISRHHRQR